MAYMRAIDNPKHWYDRAAKMRTLAESVKCFETKTIMRRLADEYDRMGDRAQNEKL